MSTFWKAAPWISKLILLLPTALFVIIALQHLVHPASMAAEEGFAFTSPVGPTIFRAIFAGFPLGSAAFVIYCLASNGRTLTGLIYLTLLFGFVLAIRIYGMVIDSSVQQSLFLAEAEIVVITILLVGIALEIGRRSRTRRAIPTSGAGGLA